MSIAALVAMEDNTKQPGRKLRPTDKSSPSPPQARLRRRGAKSPVELYQEHRERYGQFFDILASGFRIGAAAKIAKVSRSSITTLRIQLPDFRVRFEQAKALSLQARCRERYELMERYLSRRARKGWMAREYEIVEEVGEDGKKRRKMRLKKMKSMIAPADARHMLDHYAEMAGLINRSAGDDGSRSTSHLHLHQHLHQSALREPFDPYDLTQITNEPRALGAYRICRELRELGRLDGGNAIVVAVGSDDGEKAGAVDPAGP